MPERNSTASDPERLPSISIVTPSFNQVAFLERTILSVLDQGYARLEYLVMDGGSSDGSASILDRYDSAISYWVSEPDAGTAAAVNRGWARSSGEILGFINSDDFYLPGTLSFVGAYFASHPETLMLYGRCQVVDSVGRPITTVGEPFDMRRLLRGEDMIPQPSTFVRRVAWEKAGAIDESLSYSMDYDFFIRVARLAPPVFVERLLSAFTVHQRGKTTQDRATARQETFRVASRYATGSRQLLLSTLALRSRVYHGLPVRLRHRLDRLRHLPVENR
jgi:glycosyltransferase involved in cell wall biosynthesis